MTITSTLLSVSAADIVMDQLEAHKRPRFYTNLTGGARHTAVKTSAVPLDLSLPLKRLGGYPASRGLPFVNISDVVRACGGDDEYYPYDDTSM